MSSDEAARDLRRRIVSTSTGSLRVRRDELVRSLVPGGSPETASIDASPAQIARAVLAHHGIEARPAVEAASPGDDLELRATRRYATQGAVIVTIAVAVAGYVGRPLYALVLGIPAALALVLLHRAPAWVDRLVPSLVPRGRLLGMVVAGALALIPGVAIVLPLRAHYREEHESRSGDYLVRQADAAIDAGQIEQAKTLLFNAQASTPNPRYIDDVRAHLVIAQVQSIVDEAFRKDSIYQRAVREHSRGHARRAVRLLGTIPGFRDADSLRRKYRRELARG